jgi:REP element-mobilizing transposase RayT
MPRRPRVHLDGVPLHLVQRGHNREPCFFAEENYFSYLHWLEEALVEHDCVLHAYVLMTNHVHLLLTPKNVDAVPKLIISLGRRYVQYINELKGSASIYISMLVPLSFKMQERRGRLAGHARVTVGSPGYHTLEQAEHTAYPGYPVQRCDKMHFGRARIGKANVDV